MLNITLGQEDVIITVNMSTETVTSEPYPDEWKILAGRALTARMLLEKVEAKCDPLGVENKLIIAPGLLTGTSAPTSGRLSFGAKSPLTGGIKEANSGGNPGQHLAKMSIRAIVIEGAPKNSDARYGLELDENGVRLVDAKPLTGIWNYPACEKLAETYSDKASFILCGPAGEQQVAGASIACTDRDNRYPTRHAARGGLGAVMGSKGLKFIAIEPAKFLSNTRSPADKKAFATVMKKQSKRYKDGPRRMAKGTARAIGKAAGLHTLPYKNRILGQPPEADVQGLDGATILASFEKRGGNMHNCMTGCIVNCSNLVNREDGSYLTSALELETLGLLGSNCAVGKWDEVGELDRLCDDIGLDTMEMGGAIAVLMEAGEMEWGDVEAMKDLLTQIAKGTELGKVVGNGAVSVGKYTGNPRVPAVKGQALPVWDPRVMKATGVTYATSAQGADHTAGIITLVGLTHDKVAALSQEAQILNAVGDSTGYCQFIQATLNEIREYLEVILGRSVKPEELLDLGWQCLNDEWEFNTRAGFTDADDEMAECMVTEPVGEYDYRFDVKSETVAQVKKSLLPLADDFYDKPIF